MKMFKHQNYSWIELQKRYIFIIVILIEFFCVNPYIEAKSVYVFPWWKIFSSDEEFFVENPAGGYASIAIPLRDALNKLGHQLHAVSSLHDLYTADYVATFHYPADYEPQVMQCLESLPSEKLLLYIWETPIYMLSAYDKNRHQYFSKIFTWSDFWVDNVKYFKFVYPSLKAPMRRDLIPFNARKLCTLVAHCRTSSHYGELQTQRNNIVSFFERKHPQDFDVYGQWWPSTYKTYRGPAGNKLDLLNHYKFYICYENSAFSGYITEKIFDCFYSGCIPVYLGAPDIDNYIPSSCYIDRRLFASDQDLYKFLKNMPEDLYQAYLANIQEFLKSDEAFLFSTEYFVHSFISAIFPEYDKDLVFTKEQQDRLAKMRACIKVCPTY